MRRVFRIEFGHVIDVIADSEDEAIDKAMEELDGEGVGEIVGITELEVEEDDK